MLFFCSNMHIIPALQYFLCFLEYNCLLSDHTHASLTFQTCTDGAITATYFGIVLGSFADFVPLSIKALMHGIALYMCGFESQLYPLIFSPK